MLPGKQKRSSVRSEVGTGVGGNRDARRKQIRNSVCRAEILAMTKASSSDRSLKLDNRDDSGTGRLNPVKGVPVG